MNQLNNDMNNTLEQKKKRVILAGGGSGGPVVPLLAVAAELKKSDPDVEFLFVGTTSGPEQKLVQAAGIKFTSLKAAKLRRYFSLKNFSDIFVFFKSLFTAKRIISEFSPQVIFSAAGFVSLPLSWVGKIMGVKIVIHQQDALISLTNMLSAPVADSITAAFEDTAKEMKRGAVWVGNPVRSEFFSPASPDAKKKFNLHDELPVLLITGGGTGADQINTVVAECLPELVKAHQVIHLTGAGKTASDLQHRDYHPYEFLSNEMVDALKIADIVIARAGLSTLAELSALGKISVIVPMPDSHQEHNAKILKSKNAAVVLYKNEFNAEDLPRIINSVKFNAARQKTLSENMKNIMPHDAAKKIAEIIKKYL